MCNWSKGRKFYNRRGLTIDDVRGLIAFFDKEGKDWTHLAHYYLEMITTGPDPNDTT